MSSTDKMAAEPPTDSPDSRVDEFRKHVNHLKKHAALDRIKISVTATEMLKYVRENQPDDPLAMGGAPKNNPYAQKNKCITL